MSRLLHVVLFCGLLCVFGCNAEPETSTAAEPDKEPPVPQSKGGGGADEQRPPVTETGLRIALDIDPDQGQFAIQEGRLIAASLAGTKVKDLSPLKGEPVRELLLSATPVTDLSPLVDMPLERLELMQTPITNDDLAPLGKIETLSNLSLLETKVSDLSALKGLPLQYLSLIDTNVDNEALAVLKTLPKLEIVWLGGTEVTDLTPLAETTLISIDIENTDVADLTPLSKMQNLQRLNLAETKVRDLSPLKGLKLTRVLFSPKQVGKGLDAVREMETVTEIGPDFESKMRPAQFWAKYDRGEYFSVVAP